MPGTLYNPQAVTVGLAVLYLKPYDFRVPAVMLPDETPLFDIAAWEDEDWLGAGATNEGFAVNAESSTTPVRIEEQSTQVGEKLDTRAISFEAALAEDTLENQRMAWGGSNIVSSAASASAPGTRRMTLSDEILYYAAVLETRNFLGFARRIFVPQMSVAGSGSTAFRRAADKRAYPVRFNSLSAPSEIQIVDVVASKTS